MIQHRSVLFLTTCAAWAMGWCGSQVGVESADGTVKVFILAGQSNMKHIIRDVRRDLGAPHLPFVIAALGNNGSTPASGGMLAVREAQMSMNDVPEFQENVRAFRTDVLVDQAAEELFPTWRDNFQQWQKVGSDRPYHYFGSAIWFTRIGHAAGEAMLELLKDGD